MRNLITDVAGLEVGNAQDARLISGVTAIVLERPAVASVSVLGGAPGGRDLGCLEPDAVVQGVDAIVLSGGSGFGLDAASGVQAWLRERGRGFAVGPSMVPIVPSAICFDLNNGGDKSWSRYPPYRELGYAAASAAGNSFALGTAGGGYGASTVDLKGGLGSASALTSTGHTVGAIVVVNALGSALLGQGPQFFAGALEFQGEFGDLGVPPRMDVAGPPTWKGGPRTPLGPPLATTIACVATDARLDKSETKRIAVAANAGLARGLRLSHAAMDGDTIFAVATGQRAKSEGFHDLIEIGSLAADCLSRAIARAVFEAHIPGRSWVGPPAWRDRFPEAAARVASARAQS